MVDVTWRKYEKGIRSNDTDTQIKSTEAFVAERDLQLKTSASARRWEQDRKKELAQNKPLWRKAKDKKREEDQKKPFEKLLQAGVFDSGLTPAPGYVLLGIDKQETVSDSGIVIAQEVEESNEGVVLEIGKELILEKNTVPCPCKKGDKILFKRGAGLNLTIKDRNCKLIYFPDILGIFK
jgi:co-chaperonin GroES (HSP10)